LILNCLNPRALLTIAALLWGASPALAEDHEPPVISIDSPNFSQGEISRVESALDIRPGAPIDPRKLDQGIRLLFEKGEIQTLFIDTEPSGDGVTVTLRGEMVRILRHLTFNEVDPEILAEIKRRPDIQEGDRTSQRSFAQLRERLHAAYEHRGYNYADIQIDVHDVPNSQEADVEVTVKANHPTLISKFSVVGASPEENQQLADQVSLKVGSRFSNEAVEESIERINRYLRNNEYPTSRVEDTNLHYSVDRLLVSVQFTVRMGKRYQFEFSGNTVFMSSELRDLLTPEMLTQSDAVTKVAALIEEKYRQIGYYFCKVTTRNVPDDRGRVNIVRFEIDEGRKVIIDKIDFSGVQGTFESDLEDLFYENAPGVLSRHIYWEEGVPDALKNMTAKLQQQGYLNPSIVGPKTVFSEDKKGVSLYFEADLGPRSLVDRIDFIGMTRYDPAVLEKELPVQKGAPLNKDKVDQAKGVILGKYFSDGFIDAKIDNQEPLINLSRDQQHATVAFHITEGSQYRVGKISLQGNRKTKDEIIYREMQVKAGDNYDPVKVKRSEQDINLLGLFSRVEVQSTPEPGDPHVKDLTIIVKEIDPGLGEIGLGVDYQDPQLRIRGIFGISYRNLQGLDQTLSLRNQVALPLTGPTGPLSFVEYSSVLGYRAPRPFDLPVDFSAQLGVSRFEVSTVGPEYTGPVAPNLPTPGSLTAGPTLQNQEQITFSLEKKLSEQVKLRYRLYHFEFDDTDVLHYYLDGTPNSVHDRIGSTGPGIVVDFRDDTFNPTRGSYHTLDFEFAHPYLLSDPSTGFIMGTLRNSFYVPLVHPFQFTFFAGLVGAHSITGEQLPQARLLYDLALGGETSIRGFMLNIFTPITSATDAAYYNLRGEIKAPIVGDLYGAVFMDTGQIFSNGVNYLRHDGVGFGLRYKTPVGPIIVDIAQGLGPDKGSVMFYFTVGSI